MHALFTLPLNKCSIGMCIDLSCHLARLCIFNGNLLLLPPASCPQVSTSQTEYKVHWERGEISVVKGKKKQCRTDFAMELLAMIEAGPLTGYQVRVTRQVDMKTRYGSRIVHYTVHLPRWHKHPNNLQL